MALSRPHAALSSSAPTSTTSPAPTSSCTSARSRPSRASQVSRGFPSSRQVATRLVVDVATIDRLIWRHPTQRGARMTLDLRREEILGLVDASKGLVDRRIFSDEEIYQAELEHIFARAWNFMAHESQIPN